MNILIDGQTFTTPEIRRGIGVYIKNVMNYMPKLDYIHSWYLCVSDKKNIQELDPWVMEKVHVIEAPEFQPGTDYMRNIDYTKKLESLIEELCISVLWIPNALMVNVLFLSSPVKCKVIVTIHDIIPYIFPIKEWNEAVREEYLRRIQFLKDLKPELVFVSQASANDYRKQISDVVPLNVIPLAADIHRFYRNREKNGNQDSPYILFTGGFDYRKNIDGAIDAFALAIRMYKEDEEFQQYKFVIVGDCNEEIRKHYMKRLSRKGISEKVELTGYVTDCKLADLYKNADIFFFPSKYEGFGLPVLEAMLSGAYIVSANNSSLPEVCGGYALLCDANDENDMAKKLYQAHCNRKKETIEEIHKRQNYAKSYTWEKTAEKTLSLIEKQFRKEIRKQEKKEKIAILTPWPNQKTGIANYIFNLTYYLKKYFDIDIYTEAVSDDYIQADGISICHINMFLKRKKEYQNVIYEFGNNSLFHKTIYKIFDEESGIAEIHDHVLTPFFYEMLFKNGKRKKFKELLELSYDEDGTKQYELCVKNFAHPDAMEYPMSDAVAKKSRYTIVHNHWSKEKLHNNRVCVIPLACFKNREFSVKEINAATEHIKKRIDYKNELIIGCFGWLNPNKRPEIVLGAVEKLLCRGYNLKLVFWGESNMNHINGTIQEKNLQKNVYIAGYLTEAEYEAALTITDIVINLRYPSMGESSATLCEAFQHGKAVIVSELNQYKEFPDEICWKLPVCNKETELLEQYLKHLIDDAKVRQALGNNARRYADAILDPERIALQYYELIGSKNE